MDTRPHISFLNSTLLMRYVLYQKTHITILSRTVCPGMAKIQDIIHIYWKKKIFVRRWALVHYYLHSAFMLYLPPQCHTFQMSKLFICQCWFFHSPILSLLEQLKICQMTEMEEQVREFSAKLALIPVPPPGQLHVVGSF